MKKIGIIFLLSILMFSHLNAQIYWVTNFDQAKKIASQSGKMILVDFWATWCKPCMDMSAGLWNHKELSEIADNLIFASIDIDIDKQTSQQYMVKAIPWVVLITPDGEQIWGKAGWNNKPEEWVEVLKSIPKDVAELNKAKARVVQDKKDAEANFLTASEFQMKAREMKNEELRNSFLTVSNRYFNSSKRNYKDDLKTEEIELHLLLNKVFSGSHQGVLKELEKMEQAGNESIQELRHYILAECYKRNNDDVNFRKQKELIKNLKYLGMLGETVPLK